jgi:hypothetical protein
MHTFARMPHRRKFEKTGAAMSGDDLHEIRNRRVQKVRDMYAVAVRNFSDEMLIAAHQENLRLAADDLREITRAELERRGLSTDSG